MSESPKKSPLPESLASRSQAWAVGILVTLLMFGVYAATVAPGLGIGHDTGELTTCGILQGVPHSPGYPLFVALGWLASQLPGAVEAAYKLNLLCAFEVALAMGFLGAGLSLCCRPLPALIATGLAGLSTAIWRQAVVTEVFSLHLLILCGLVWLAILWERSEDARRREILLVTSFLLGCSLAHQHIIALAGPFFLLFGWLSKGQGRSWGFSWLNLPILLGTLASCYYFQYVCALQQPVLNWGNATTWPALVDHFLRKSYGTGLLNSAAQQYDSRAGDAQVTTYFISLLRSYYPFPSFLILLPALDRILTQRFNKHSLLFGGLFLVYGPLFAIIGNQPSLEFYGDMMERFYSASLVGLAGISAQGLEWLCYKLHPQLQRKLPWLIALLLWNGWSNLPRSSQSGMHHATELIQAMVAQLPPRSALLIDGDLPGGTMDYCHHVLGQSQGLLYIHSGLASAPWYKDRLPAWLARRLSESASTEENLQNIAASLESRGFAVYTNNVPKDVRGEFSRYGLLWRFRGKEAPWHRERQLSELRRVFQALESCPRRSDYRIDWRQSFWIRYCIGEWVQAYEDLAKGLSETDPEKASLAMDRVISMESPIRIQSLLNRAALRLKLKRYPESVQDYEACLRMQPESRLALQGMILAQNGAGQPELAQRYAKRLESLGPEPAPSK